MANNEQSGRSPHRSNIHSADKVSGHRRKLIRRSVFIPRSNTMPVLQHPDPAASNFASSSLATGMATAFVSPHTTTAISSSASSTGPSLAPSTPTRSVEGKKRRPGLFESLKTKEYSESFPAAETSPLPPLTPKAAKVLGVTVGDTRFGVLPGESSHDLTYSEDPCVGQLQTNGGEEASRSGSLVHHPALRKRASESVLTTIKTTFRRNATLQTISKEEGAGETDLQQDAQSAGSKRKKAMRMLDLIPSLHTRGRTAPQSTHNEETNIGSGSDSDVTTQLPPGSKRRNRKKRGKSLETMPSVPEGSHSEAGSVNHSGHDLELDALYAAYGTHRASTSITSLPRSMTVPVLSTTQYESEQGELYGVGQSRDELEKLETELASPGGPLFKNTHGSPVWPLSLGNLRVRSPLQTVEHQLRNQAEDIMGTAARVPQYMSEEDKRALGELTRKNLIMAGEKFKLDTNIVQLRKRHDEWKQTIEDVQRCSIVQTEPAEDDTSSCRLRSSIDTDEEPELCTAQTLTFRLVKPNEITIIDILPPQETSIVALSKKDYPGYFDPRLSSTKQESYKEPQGLLAQPTSARSNSEHDRNEELEPFPPFVDNYYDGIVRPKKNLLPRNESRLLVQNWVDGYNSPERRPLSDRYDIDVQADRQVPPAPVPKDTRRSPMNPRPKAIPYLHTRPLLDTRNNPKIPRFAPEIPQRNPLRPSIKTPTRPSPQPPKAHCICIGHTLRLINLEKVPDDVAIGSTGAPPNLHIQSGTKQHMRIPVRCDICRKDVDENFWQCEIPVCHMSYCAGCAKTSQEDAKKRNLESWKH